MQDWMVIYMLKAIILDLDGVVTDTAKFHYIAWKQLAQELGIEFDEVFNERLKGVSRMDSLDLILEHGDKKHAYTLEEKMILAETKNREYRKLLNSMTSMDILPGIPGFLMELRTASIKIALASISKNADYIVKHLNLEDYFDYIANANEIKRTKPFPDIFIKCAEKLVVRPEECIGIEDAKAGVQAIKAANMKAIGIGTVDQMKNADLILDSTVLLSLDLIKDTFNM
jgi:beta-phosphoglucomutase